MIPAVEGFVARSLSLAGALVEGRKDGALEAILPDALVQSLVLPEAVRLTALGETREGVVACGLGTPVLERLLGRARVGVLVACARLCGQARTGHARSIADRLPIRNGVADLVAAGPSEGGYLDARVA